jgi:protein-L-isoaspartate(D-aspartate) O-methyltransferase
MTTADALRGFYARFVATSAGVEDARIIDAFTAVRREPFVGRGPWQIKVPNGSISTETDNPAVLYQDILVGLIPERGINNGEPSLHAKCLGAAAPQAGEIILHIGAGTGLHSHSGASGR